MVAVISVLGMEQILHLIGASENTIGFARQYLTIISIGAPTIMFSTAFANILRGEGASRESMVGNLLGTIVNIILDPVMIGTCDYHRKYCCLFLLYFLLCTRKIHAVYSCEGFQDGRGNRGFGSSDRYSGFPE